MSLKVALVSEWVDAWRGGAETSTLQFLHHLMDAGIEIHLFTRSRPAAAPKLHVHSIKVGKGSRWGATRAFIHGVSDRIREGSYDVVHAISPCSSADIYQPRGGTLAEVVERNIALRGTGFKQALKRYGNRFNLKQQRLLAWERQLMTDPNGPVVIALSDYVKRQLRDHYDIPDDRIRQVYNGVNADDSSEAQRLDDRRQIRADYEISDDCLLVIQVAHNFRLKGVATWISALSCLRAGGMNNIRSLLIGRGDSPAWHRRAQKMGVAEALTFVGATERIQRFYHAADVLVHPTFYDPCSRVVLEAMISGLPCVTTRWDGASEMIDHGMNGFVLDDPADATVLAEVVSKLLSPELRARVGAAATQIRDRVSMKRHADSVRQLYAEVIQTRTRA